MIFFRLHIQNVLIFFWKMEKKYQRRKSIKVKDENVFPCILPHPKGLRGRGFELFRGGFDYILVA